MTTGYAPAPDQHTADSAAVPLDTIRSLVDERGRYEGWLHALDGRRGVTPEHVLERVRQDYTGRLDRVAEQLASHAVALQAHERMLADQHHEVEQRLEAERDALAEVELRTLVGEYPAAEGEQRRATAEQSIATLERELGGAKAMLGDVRGLVARVAPASASAPAVAPGDARSDAPSADVVADGMTGPESPAADAPSDAPAVEAASTAADAFGASAAESGSSVDVGLAGVDAPIAGRDVLGTPFDSNAGFDHGAVDAARVALGDRAPSLTPAFNDAIRAGSPGSYGVGSGRGQAAEPAASGQEKTLRCQDCGALNYPTEWYCEKCGGELAAL